MDFGKTKSGDHSFFFFIVKLYKIFFVVVDRDWISNPMTKCISPCCAHVKFSFIKTAVFLVKAMNKPLKENEKHHVFYLFVNIHLKVHLLICFS